MQIAARVSTGEPFVEIPAEKGTVAIWTGEDSLPKTLVPRLKACNADMKKIKFVSESIENGKNRVFDIASDIPPLCEALSQIDDLKLLILDPIVGIVGNSKDSYKATEVRKALEPLLEMVRKKGAAVIGITHFAKAQSSGNAGALDRVIGSQAWGAVARVVVCCDRSDDLQTNIMAMVKNNLVQGDHAYQYILDTAVVGKKNIKTSYALFTLNDLMRPADELFRKMSNPEEKDNAKSAARDWLLKYFDEANNGGKPVQKVWSDVVKDAAGDHTPATLKRARNDLKADGYLDFDWIGERKSMWFKKDENDKKL